MVSWETTGFQTFQTIVNSIQAHYQTILNYFNNRSTNAAAESFNAKIKAFRATSRGVRDVKFFPCFDFQKFMLEKVNPQLLIDLLFRLDFLDWPLIYVC